MVRFGKTETPKEKFFAEKKKNYKNLDVNVDNIVISKLVKTKINSKYLIGYSDKDIRRLVLIMPKMSGYVKIFKVEDKNSKLMSFRRDDEKLLEKYKTIWIKIEDLKNIKLNSLPVVDRYIKTKIRTYGDKVYTKFRGVNLPEDDIECECFTVISIDPLLVYENKDYLQVYTDNCACKIANKQMTDYLDKKVFED